MATATASVSPKNGSVLAFTGKAFKRFDIQDRYTLIISVLVAVGFIEVGFIECRNFSSSSGWNSFAESRLDFVPAATNSDGRDEKVCRSQI